jgi:hypothetical protein
MTGNATARELSGTPGPGLKTAAAAMRGASGEPETASLRKSRGAA